MKLITYLLMILFVLSCQPDKNSNPDDGVLVPPPVNPDPTSYSWSVSGPTMPGLNSCVGPYSISSDIQLQRDLYIDIFSENSSTLKFYSDSGCSNITNEVKVKEGSKNSSFVYAKNTANKVSEMALVGFYIEGDSSALSRFPINFKNYSEIIINQ